jgi:hypothetical protein
LAIELHALPVEQVSGRVEVLEHVEVHLDLEGVETIGYDLRDRGLDVRQTATDEPGSRMTPTMPSSASTCCSVTDGGRASSRLERGARGCGAWRARRPRKARFITRTTKTARRRSSEVVPRPRLPRRR